MFRFVVDFFRDERGATAIEYGLIVALISVAILTAVTSVGSNMKTQFNFIANKL